MSKCRCVADLLAGQMATTAPNHCLLQLQVCPEHHPTALGTEAHRERHHLRGGCPR